VCYPAAETYLGVGPAGRHQVNQQDQQAIDELFQHLYKSAAQAGPRDPQAEALIQQHFQQAPPGLLYHMAQTLVAQHHALQQAQAQLAAYQQQSGSPAGFAPPGPQSAAQPGYPGYGQPTYQQQPGPYQPTYQPPAGQQQGHHGFLAGAGKIAAGVGGGILGAEALRGIFGGGGLFGGDRDGYDRDYGFGGQDDRDSGFGGQDDYGGQDSGDGGFDDGGSGGDDGGW
jgi:uncharacterized protein